MASANVAQGTTEQELTRQHDEAVSALESAYQDDLIRLLNEVQAAKDLQLNREVAHV